MLYRTLTCAILLAFLAGGSLSAGAQSAGNYVIGAQDVLTIQLFDQPEIGGRFTVEADGTFTFPMIGRIEAKGRTLRQLEDDLRKRLADGYFRNPQVSVAVEQYRSQRIFVMGEVRTPGAVALTGDMTLVEALVRAGSTLPTASGEIVIVRAPTGSTRAMLPNEDGAEMFRANLRELESGELKQNIDLRDGDTIYVPRAETIYVFGQVRNPNAYPVRKDTTVLQALSLAGGATENAALNRIRIVRVENGQTIEIKVKLTDVVRPGDTIKVPERYF